MSSDAYKDVWKEINKRAEKIRRLKGESASNKTYVEEILRFLNNIDLLAQLSSNEVSMQVSLEQECALLFSRLKTFDPYVHATVEWNSVENWKDLRPLGVRIQWSNYYLRLYKKDSNEEYVDITSILLEDF